MKRYAIVRVDKNQCNKCEMYYVNDNGNNDCRLRLGASFLCDRYGDTKEQIVRKIAQVLYRDELRFCIWKEDIKYLPKIYERCLEKARKIVEFLGVFE